MKSDLYFRSHRKRAGGKARAEGVCLEQRLSGQKYTEECSKQTNEEDTSGVWPCNPEIPDLGGRGWKISSSRPAGATK